MTDILELGKRRASDAGIHVYSANCLPGYASVYLAEAVEKLLGEGVELEMKKLGDSGLTDQHRAGWAGHEPGTWLVECSHRSLAIAIRPIARPDTAESLLIEIVQRMNHMVCPSADVYKAIERAKEFLSRGGKCAP